MLTSSRLQYDTYCYKTAEALPLYYQPWWLDAVCGQKGWHPLVRPGQSDMPTAIWPVYCKSYGPLQYCTLPPLTKRLGYHTDNQGRAPVAEFRHLFPRFVYLLTGLEPIESDTQQLQEQGFLIKQALTYRTEHQTDPDRYEHGLHELARRNIRKAQAALSIEPEEGVETLHRLINSSMQRHQKRHELNRSLLENVWNACVQRGQGGVFKAVDSTNRVHAAVLVAWDSNWMYYLAAGMDSAVPQVGASRLLMRHVMRLAFERGLGFDFNGGTAPAMGRVYASMGAQPHAYVRASLYRPRFMEQIITRAKQWYASSSASFQ